MVAESGESTLLRTLKIRMELHGVKHFDADHVKEALGFCLNAPRRTVKEATPACSMKLHGGVDVVVL